MTRNFEIIEVDQGTDEWFAARAGLLTGSIASAVYAAPTTAARADAKLQMAVERITGAAQIDGFTNKHIERGHDMEPMCRIAVEAAHKVVLLETGFLRHKTLPIGCSLDGHVNDFQKLAELKCPKSTTHVKYLQGGKLPAEYRWQVIHNLYVTGAQSCIFASYDDRVPEGLELFSIEVFAKDLPMEEYERDMKAFLAEVDALQAQLLEMQKQRREACLA